MNEKEQYAQLLELRLKKDALGLVDLAENEATVPLVRLGALHKLGSIGDETVLPRLSRLLEDDNPDMRVAALCAIGRSGCRSAREILTAAVEHHDHTVVGWALHYLERRGELSTEVLVPFLTHPDKMVRGTAVKALRRSGDNAAAQPLRALAKRERGAARAAALAAAAIVARRRDKR